MHIYRQIVDEQLSVRDVEALIKTGTTGRKKELPGFPGNRAQNQRNRSGWQRGDRRNHQLHQHFKPCGADGRGPGREEGSGAWLEV